MIFFSLSLGLPQQPAQRHVPHGEFWVEDTWSLSLQDCLGSGCQGGPARAFGAATAAQCSQTGLGFLGEELEKAQVSTEQLCRWVEVLARAGAARQIYMYTEKMMILFNLFGESV